MWLLLGFLHSYHKATLCMLSFLFVPCVNSTDCFLVQSLGLIQQAMGSGARLLLASLNFGSGLLLIALSVVASTTQLHSLSASVLPGDHRNDHSFNASENQAIRKKPKPFLLKNVSEILFLHLKIKENVPEEVSICIHFALSSLYWSLPDSISLPVFSSNFQVSVGTILWELVLTVCLTYEYRGRHQLTVALWE